jgi:hypothetical protein
MRRLTSDWAFFDRSAWNRSCATIRKIIRCRNEARSRRDQNHRTSVRCHLRVWTVLASEFVSIKENKVPGIGLVVTQDSSALKNPEASAVRGNFRPNADWSGNVEWKAKHATQQRGAVQQAYTVPICISLAHLRGNKTF